MRWPRRGRRTPVRWRARTPMPCSQSGLTTTVTSWASSSRRASSAAAPSTTTTPSHPDSDSTACTSQPSTSALGRPIRRPAPAARSSPVVVTRPSCRLRLSGPARPTAIRCPDIHAVLFSVTAWRNTSRSTASWNRRPTGPGIFELPLRAPAATMRSTRSRRSCSYAARARRHVRSVPERHREHDRVLERHRGALSRARRGGVGRVADQHHPVARPCRYVRQVVGVVAGQLELAIGHQVRCRPRVVADQLEQALPPFLRRGRDPLVATDLPARDVDEPHHVARGCRVRPEERAAAEHEVPRLRLEVAGNGGVPGDATEVGQPHVATTGRLRVDGPADERVHTVGPDEDVSLDGRAVVEHCAHPVLSAGRPPRPGRHGVRRHPGARPRPPAARPARTASS